MATKPISLDDTPLARLAKRPAESNKGSYGRALLIGGSRGMAGAAALAGMAALRSGAGLVRLAVADCCLDTVASFEPSMMTSPLASDAEGRIAGAARERLAELTTASAATSIGCGPGLSRSAELDELVAWLYTSLAQPAVFDADALNALAAQPKILHKPGGPRILTPHPGEFARLVGAKEIEPREVQEQRAIELAATAGVVIVLKGHHTLVTDGAHYAHNTTGNPGMATGGTGDVLTGITTALLGQQFDTADGQSGAQSKSIGFARTLFPRGNGQGEGEQRPTPSRIFNVARLAVHIHGLAGDLAAAELGEVSLIASDLIRFLPASFCTTSD